MKQILEEIKDAKTIGISGHIRPDGDCIGACMALYQYLINNTDQIEIDIYLEDIPEEFLILSHIEEAKKSYQKEITYDLFFALDCSSVDRLGKIQSTFLNAKRTIVIDHHITNTNFGQLNHIVEASSTCETLFELLDLDKIDLDIANCLYIGIVFDTGVFKHSNTTKRTMEIAGILMEKGIPFSKIIDEMFYQKTYVQNQILGRCLLESMLVLHKTCIVSTVTEKILKFYGATSKDLDGIIDQMRVTKDIEVAILIYEIGMQEYKVSLRSNGKVNVSKIAVYFGGGGHIKAAGCTMRGSVHDVINNLTKHIEIQL